MLKERHVLLVSSDYLCSWNLRETAAGWVQTVCSRVWNIHIVVHLRKSLTEVIPQWWDPLNPHLQLIVLPGHKVSTFFEAHEHRLEHCPKDRHSGCTLTLSHMYHKHTVLHFHSNCLPGYSTKHIHQPRFKLPNFGYMVKVDTSCLHI